MKKLFQVLLLIPLILTFFNCGHGSIVGPGSNNNFTSADKVVASSSAQFGLNLLKEIDKSEADSNIFISPLSISTALGMTLNGANGETYSQMRNTLQLPGAAQDQVNQSFLNLNNILTTTDPKVTFTDANSIWYRQGLSFEQSFLDVNKKYFNASDQSLDFTNPASVGIINNWVNDNTDGKITQIINAIQRDAVMYLINAIYFKAEWTSKFDSLKTTIRPFHPLQGSLFCPMMNQKNNFNYFVGSDYRALEIPYSNGNFNMLIILPNDSIDVNQVLSRVDLSMLNQISAGMTQQQVNLYLPRFQVNYFASLKNPLINLGMVDAFEPLADFSNISKITGLMISDVLHKTYVKVGEQGTEAAAVTAVIMMTTSIENPVPETVFSVDNPFIFLITEKNSGAILFAGKIVNPVN